jgi:hypothetical protein
VSAGRSGYNPLLTVNSSLTSLECFSFECANYEYEYSPASLIQYTDCRDIRNCTTVEFETMAPTNSSNRVCEYLTNCTTSQFQIIAPTKFSDRVCENATICFDVVQLAAYSSTNLTVVNGSVVILPSAPQLEYEFTPLTLTSDRTCANVTTCADDEYVDTDPTTTSNRVCACKL